MHKFISFESVDAAGKGTQIDLLEKRLHQEYPELEVLRCRMPGGDDLGERYLRPILKGELEVMGEIDGMTELLLFAANVSSQMHNVIKPALKAGKLVISDRFIDSQYAYQGFARGVPTDPIVRSVQQYSCHAIEPSITFYLRMSYEEMLRRISERGVVKTDRFESKEGKSFHEKAIAGYDEAARRCEYRVVVLDATKSIEEIHEQIWATYTNVAQKLINCW